MGGNPGGARAGRAWGAQLRPRCDGPAPRSSTGEIRRGGFSNQAAGKTGYGVERSRRRGPKGSTIRGPDGRIDFGRNAMSTAYAATPAGEAERTSTYAWVVLAMLTCIYTFNFLDRQLLANLTENI